MDALSLKQLVDLTCARYGQLVTKLDVYRLTDDVLETILKDVVAEYSYYVPMTKELNVQGSPSGTYLGEDIISVRNVRMNNFYFSKMSPRMGRRERKFNPHTKMLYMPLSLPVIVECGAKYPIARTTIKETVDTMLPNDTYITIKLDNFRYGSLSINIGTSSWNDKDTNYTQNPCSLSGDTGTAVYDTATQILKISNISVPTATGVVVQYNTDTSVVQGLGLRDKRFIDLFIGRVLIALGNMKSEIQMEGDIISFNASDVLAQGNELVNTTLEILNTSSTTYKVL